MGSVLGGIARSVLSPAPTRAIAPAALLAGSVATAAVALPVLLWLHDLELVSGEPWVLAVLLPLAALGSSRALQRAVGGSRVERRPVLRLALAFAAMAAFCWTAGWSLLVPVYAVLIAVVHVHSAGSRVWRPAALLAVAFTLAGEVAVALDVLPSVVEEPRGHLAAAWILSATLLAIAGSGMSAASAEAAAHALARTEGRLRALMDSSTDVLTVSDGDGVLTYVSPAVQRGLGYAPETLLGTRLLDLVDSDDRDAVTARLDDVVASGPGARTSMDVLVVLASHERRWYEWTVHNLLHDPLVQGLVVDQRDVTERLLHQEELAHAAAHDDLTGLANRGELLRRLEAVLPQASQGGGVAVVFIDLDRFKEVNDTYGHAAGDELLTVVAQRLQACLRAHDVLARLGGDEFCAILTEVGGEAEVEAIVDRLERAVTQPVVLHGMHLEVGASMGTALALDDSRSAEALFGAADAAMYRIKNGRRAAAGEEPRTTGPGR